MKKIEEKKLLKAAIGAIKRTIVADDETSAYLSKADHKRGQEEGREMPPTEKAGRVIQLSTNRNNRGGGNSK